MKGLVLKDFYIIRRYYAKVGLILMAFYTLVVILNSGNLEMVVMMSTMLTLVYTIMPISAFTCDATDKWDRYALSMPMTRRTLVLSRYLFSWLMMLGGTLISVAFLLLNGAISRQFLTARELFNMFGMLLSFGVVFGSIVLPLTYQFGAEKARYAIFFLAMVPALFNLMTDKLQISFIRLPELEGLIAFVKLFAPVLVVGLAALSYCCSAWIYGRKEIA